MSNLPRIFSAVLLAGTIAIVIGQMTDFVYFSGPAVAEDKRGFTLDTKVAAGGTAAAPAGAADITALYATADVKAGSDYFSKKCTVCHTIEKGGAAKVGPSLWGVMNRSVAGIAGFNYSSAMKAKGGTWTFEEMNKFQWDPKKTVPGTLMGFMGTRDDKTRANLIAYLNSMSDSPAKLPAK